eukprot:jgi/Tetstr1/439378/TSEL_027813.t1
MPIGATAFSVGNVATEERRNKLHQLHNHGVPEYISSILARWEELRTAPWESYLVSDCPGSVQLSELRPSDKDRLQLSGLVHGGVPRHYRASVWRSFLELEKKAVAGEYAELWCRVLVAYAPPEAIVRELRGEDDSMADAHSDCELELSSDAEEEFLTPRGSTVSLDSDIPDASAGSGGSLDRSWSNQFWYSVSLGSPRSPLDSPKFVDRLRDSASKSQQRCSPLSIGNSADDPQASPDGAEASMRRHHSDWILAIEQDLERTLPDHLFMQDPGNRYAVFRILATYSERNPEVGYCQGMNVLACIALMVMHDEEDAFWCLAAMVEDLLGGYFASVQGEGCLDPVELDSKVLESLVAHYQPRLTEHFEFLGVSVPCLSASWFLSAFANCMPLEAVLRLWDLMFFERSSSVIFRAALAMLDMLSQDILRCEDAADVYTLLRRKCETLYDANELMIIASSKYSGVDASLVEGRRAEVAGGSTDLHDPQHALLQYFICSSLKEVQTGRCAASASANTPSSGTKLSRHPDTSGHGTCGSGPTGAPVVLSCR